MVVLLVLCFLLDNEVTGDPNTAVIDEYDPGSVDVKRSVTDRDRLTGRNDGFSGSVPFVPKSRRRKRSLSAEHVVELMVVADKKMADYHGEQLHNYVLTLMSIVSVLGTPLQQSGR